ncbi:hypothetical protein CALCODRAFT_487904 [Calocera cornea HHB12733]|uniref:Uncharacterized protein n=1 Tax=Calocera cornea HHB12733 TaxID=1353952 RepID=A0A165CVH6_9BASI|nr:hypothetical protein CALCODRAFT_487904 [Calocera cornea HHB12733]
MESTSSSSASLQRDTFHPYASLDWIALPWLRGCPRAAIPFWIPGLPYDTRIYSGAVYNKYLRNGTISAEEDSVLFRPSARGTAVVSYIGFYAALELFSLNKYPNRLRAGLRLGIAAVAGVVLYPTAVHKGTSNMLKDSPATLQTMEKMFKESEELFAKMKAEKVAARGGKTKEAPVLIIEAVKALGETSGEPKTHTQEPEIDFGAWNSGSPQSERGSRRH